MNDVVADLTIEALAHDNIELRARVASLEANEAIYRELVVVAIDALYGKTVAGDRQRARYLRLLDAYRALRLQLLRKPVAA